jgi:hypothetical protein
MRAANVNDHEARNARCDRAHNPAVARAFQCLSDLQRRVTEIENLQGLRRYLSASDVARDPCWREPMTGSPKRIRVRQCRVCNHPERARRRSFASDDMQERKPL